MTRHDDDRTAPFREMAERIAEQALGWLNGHPNAPLPEAECYEFLAHFIDCYLTGVLGDRADGPHEVRFREYYWRRALADRLVENPSAEGSA